MRLGMGWNDVGVASTEEAIGNVGCGYVAFLDDGIGQYNLRSFDCGGEVSFHRKCLRCSKIGC